MTRRAALEAARFMPVALLILSAAAIAHAQEPPEAESAPRRAIRGRVLGDGNRPVVNVTVRVGRIGSRVSSAAVTPEPDGSFRFEDLDEGTYTVFAYAPAYVSDEASGSVIARPGDDVTVRLTRGGVIAGRVTSADGDAVVLVPVRAQRVRDNRGKPVRSQDYYHETVTDDRGEYRLFGLAGGTYLVMAGGKTDYAFAPSIYTADAPTYHPSSTADGALPVALQPGQEVTAVDIRYRSLTGRRISGRIGRPAARVHGSGGIRLMSLDGTLLAAEPGRPAPGGGWSFEIAGMGDGEYLLWGTVMNDSGVIAGSATRHVVVRGADVTNVSLAVVQYGSLAGTVSIAPGNLPEECAKAPRRTVLETAITVARDTRGETDAVRAQSGYSIVPDQAGAFQQRGVRPGKYWLVPSLPPDLFVQSISNGNSAPVSTKVRAAGAPFDATVVGPGKALAGIRIVVARGAAQLSGQIVFGDRRADGKRAVVHLVPAETDADGDVVRYYEVEANADGTFALTSLAPGRYWAVVELEPSDDLDRTNRRAAWQAAERRRLHAAGADHGIEVELTSCKGLTDLRVPLR